MLNLGQSTFETYLVGNNHEIDTSVSFSFEQEIQPELNPGAHKHSCDSYESHQNHFRHGIIFRKVIFEAYKLDDVFHLQAEDKKW